MGDDILQGDTQLLERIVPLLCKELEVRHEARRAHTGSGKTLTAILLNSKPSFFR